jgi:hypothetical protein
VVEHYNIFADSKKIKICLCENTRCWILLKRLVEIIETRGIYGAEICQAQMIVMK